MKIAVEGQVAEDGSKVAIETKLDDVRVSMTEYIYEEIDRQILENMPNDVLEELRVKVTKEVYKRIADGNW